VVVLKIRISHGSAATHFRRGRQFFDESRKGFCENLPVKFFSKSVNIPVSYRKNTACFFQCRRITFQDAILRDSLFTKYIT